MISENLKNIELKIESACKKAGRNRDEVKIIAVSKTKPIPVLIEALACGLIDLGENKAQELNQKFPQITEPVKWHFIGNLQTNKVKYVIEPSDYIHSVTTIKLAAEINKRAEKIDKVQKILIEVNTSNEDSKHGLTNDEDLIELISYCNEQKNLDVKGLMTMAPFIDDEKILRDSFKKLREKKEFINNKGFNLTELSMGMTNDFEIAIEEGSTMVRIGTALFGERDYSKSWNVQ